jgi:UDP-N-acetylmuramoyl-tripeptide--D-alanyl-D-alanine ligase
MGARGIGHIEYLTGIAPPSVGVVLNIGTAHLGEFGGFDAIVQGKGELIDALPADGLAVLNADDERVRTMSSRSRARVVMFGFSEDAQVRGRDVTLDDRGRPRFTLIAPDGTAAVSMLLTGEHQVANALAAAAVAQHAGMSVSEIAKALSVFTPASQGRMEITERADGVTVVNDAYNANPHSTRAALRALVAMAGSRRRIVVLGGMLGLGDEAEEQHIATGAFAASLGIELVVTVGDEEGRWLADGARAARQAQVVAVSDNDAAREALANLLLPGDIVLFKASQPTGLQALGDELAQPSADGDDGADR